ncbi:polysaccharide biosynthesis tyrosine autokinase [Actinomycetospora endophytica]|uniref:non-specific protein-tyrosine kinase n=1 Tax=Actinomycetospora endophytica TaxID=2291215 RepID=A0ABS8PD25_9PSEU|nr:polysaccharide biosynthesis tyrosine autokinase [Actinomycetospora endophytica]MCD2196156.1 polysaccharide biosynthesis tyrosine autokinase [Actinomycetospora endophytica]
MTFVELWRVIRSRYLIIVAFVAVGLLSAVAVTLLTTPKYSSTATLYISSAPSAENAQSAYQGGLLSQQRIESYVELAASPRVASDVANSLNNGVSPNDLLKEVTASSEPDTVVLQITATDQSSVQAADYANRFAASFSNLIRELEQPSDSKLPPAVAARVVQPATPNDLIVSPQAGLNIGVGLLAGLFAGLFVAAVRENLDRSIHNVDELRLATDVSVVGAIPVSSDRLAVRNEPGPVAEAYRQLRTSLDFMNVDEPPRTVLVTSAVEGEGKTTAVCNLAAVLADAGRTVLIVDGDLRRPAVADVFGVERAIGVSSVLAGRVGADDAIQPTHIPRLSVLASGPQPPNPNELLSSDQMRLLIERVSKSFDMVLIDAPPVLPVADALAMTAVSDGSLFVVRAGATDKRRVKDALDLMASVSAHVLGIVLLAAPSSARYGNYSYKAAKSDISDESRRSQPSADADEATTTEQVRPTPWQRH